MISPLGTTILCPVLIGRVSQLESLSRLIEQALSGAGHAVLVAGEAGIGKSRLVDEAKYQAAQYGFNILQGSCFEPDRALPYAPFLDLLRTFNASHTDNEITDAFETAASELIKLVPELATRLAGITPSSALEPEAEKRRLFNALAQFFTQRESSEHTPLLIVIEDLHWSDDTSLDFLLHLARRIASKPILLLLTFRSDESNPVLEHFLGDLNRERIATELVLQHLTRAEMDEMLRAILKTNHSMSNSFLQKLYALTEGNPFFIEEVLKSMAISGSIFLEQGRWKHQPVSELNIPRSIKDAVRSRAENLSPKARHLLELAAVAGRRFDFSLLQELAQLDEQDLLFLMKELVSAQLVVEESPDQFSFRHALTREAVYLSLLIRERKIVHRQAAELLERLYASSLDSQVSNLAYHYFQAGVWEKAFTYSQLAGEKAQALYAPHTAIEHFTLALEAAQHLATSSPSTVFRRRGQTYEMVGEFARAQADYESASIFAEKAHDSMGEWQALIDLGSLWAERDYQRTGDYFQQALHLAQKIGDRAILAHSLNRLGNWLANIGDLDEALRLHQQALDIFQELNDQRGKAETLDLLGMTSQMNGDLTQGAMDYQRAVELFLELDDRRGLVSSLATLTLCGPSYLHNPSFSPFNLQEAIEKGEKALKIAQEIGWRSGEIYALHCLSICLGPQGAIQRAMELVQSSLEISEEIGHDQWLIGAHCDLGMLYLEVFALSQARQHLELALTLAQEIGSSVWIGSVTGYLASVCIVQGDLSRAESVLDAEINPETPAITQMQRLCWCARAELSLARGKPDLALSIIDRLIAFNPNGTPPVSIPRLSILRGEALGALQRKEEAEKELQSALAASTKQGARSLSWRIHLGLGKRYQARGSQSEADTEFNAARVIIEAIAASIQDQKILETFLAHAMTLLPTPAFISPRRLEKEKFGGLTAREREVAALIAQGKSNREIAEALVVSERTVESHVTNILTKLDFTSRARIAAWAVDKGLI